MLFKEFGEKVSTTFQASEPTESAELAEQVKTLTDENVELKKTNEIMVSFLNRNGPGYQQQSNNRIRPIIPCSRLVRLEVIIFKLTMDARNFFVRCCMLEIEDCISADAGSI